MTIRELEFIDTLLASLGNSEEVFIIDSVGYNTLSEMFDVCGKHANKKVSIGFYVLGDANWHIGGNYEPSEVYIISDSDRKLFYFSVKIDPE